MSECCSERERERERESERERETQEAHSHHGSEKDPASELAKLPGAAGRDGAPVVVAATSGREQVLPRRGVPSRRHGSRELVEEVGDLLLFCAREAVGVGVDVCAHSTRT